MPNPNIEKIENLPMPEPIGHLREIALDRWEMDLLARKASADAMTYTGHYLNGTAGRFSETEIAAMQRYRRLVEKVKVAEESDPLKIDPEPEQPVSPSLATLYFIKQFGLDAVIEMAIFERVVRAAIAQGCKVTLQDGLSAADGAEEVVVDSTDLLEIVRAARSTDADVIRLSGPIRGWIAFVWGNGAEVIADHTAGDAMAAFVDSFDRVIERLA